MRVLIVDHQRLLAEAIRPLLQRHGCEVSDVVTTAADAVASLDERQVDVVLTEVSLPDEGGIEVGRRIVQRWPTTKVIVFTGRDEPGTLRRVVAAGLHGYITKNVRVGELVSYLRTVADGRARGVATTPSRRIVDDRGQADWHVTFAASQLTRREREVLRLLVEGIDGNAIASALAISSNTVRTHIQNVLSKLQVHSRLEAVAFATRHRVALLPDRRTGAGVKEIYGDRTHPRGRLAVAVP